MDLTTSYPRSVHEKIAGVVMLARTFDKARAKAHDTIGEYHYDCPMDKGVFGFLDVDAAAFLQAATAAQNDGDIERFVRPYVERKGAAAVEQFNAGFLQSAPQPGSEGETYFHELRSSIAPDRTDVITWADLLDLDEKRSVPRRAAA